MHLSATSNLYVFGEDDDKPTIRPVERWRRDPLRSHEGGLTVYLVGFFSFDGLMLVFNGEKLIGCRNAGRVSTDASGFAREHGKAMWRALQFEQHAVHSREELTRLTYNEIAKISLKRMERMILGEED